MSIPLISYISCIYSRLSYLNPREFNASYSEIFSNKLILEQIKQIPTVSLTNLFHIDTKQIENCNEMVNKIIYLKKKEYVKNDNFMFFSISTSNYAGVFITADKTMNTITVSFRGTYSVKSALSYSKLSSLTPTVICNKKGGVLIGIYKIIHEIFNTILECINFLKSENLKKTPTVITTGHSLGGACATIFSYLYYLNTKKPIICITFGSPRVLNYELIQKYNSFIKKNNFIDILQTEIHLPNYRQIYPKVQIRHFFILMIIIINWRIFLIYAIIKLEKQFVHSNLKRRNANLI